MKFHLSFPKTTQKNYERNSDSCHECEISTTINLKSWFLIHHIPLTSEKLNEITKNSPHAVVWICRLYVFCIYPQPFKSRTENHIKKFSLLIYKSERINCLYTLHVQILKLLPLKLKTWNFSSRSIKKRHRFNAATKNRNAFGEI